MRACALLTLIITGCSTAPVTNLLDHVAPSRYESGKDEPRRPRDRPDDVSPGVFPPEPRGDDGRRGGLRDPVPELSSPFPPR